MPSRYKSYKEDPSSLIWTKQFLCKFPNIETLEENQIKEWGIYSTGDKRLDKEILPSQYNTNYLTIDKMIEYYKRGISVFICDRKDTIKIYEIIQDHLHLWSNHLENGLNIGNAPIDDLIIMDEFAEKLFQYVKHDYHKVHAHDELHKHMMGLSRFNPMKFKAKLESIQMQENGSNSTNRYENNKADNLPTRGSFSEMLKTNLSLLKGY